MPTISTQRPVVERMRLVLRSIASSLDLLQTLSVSRHGMGQSLRCPDGSKNRPKGGAPVNLDEMWAHGRLQNLIILIENLVENIVHEARYASQKWKQINTHGLCNCVSTPFHLFYKKPKTFSILKTHRVVGRSLIARQNKK
jgi:hypothetical protein